MYQSWEDKLLPQERQQLRRVAGQLNCISTQTRLDMVYAGSVVNSSIKDATVRDIITPKKFIWILKSKDTILSFTKIALICFSDASFANVKCGDSQDELLVFSEGSDGRYMLLDR